MGPDAIPVSSLIDQQLRIFSIQTNKIRINMEILFRSSGVEEVWRFREKIPLGYPLRKIIEGDKIDIVGVSFLGHFNIFEETAIDPLKSQNKIRGMQSRTKLHESTQNSQARWCGPKVEHKISEGNSIGRTII